MRHLTPLQISSGNSNINGSAVAMGRRGTEKAKRGREWLEMWLRGYAEPNNKHEDLQMMVMLKD